MRFVDPPLDPRDLWMCAGYAAHSYRLTKPDACQWHHHQHISTKWLLKVTGQARENKFRRGWGRGKRAERAVSE